MPYQAFTDWEPGTPWTKHLLGHSLDVLEEFRQLGYAITLRQLYYRLVARGLIENEQRVYKSLGEVISKGREAGYVDWEAIVDRGRRPVMPAHWDDGAQLLRDAAGQFRLDRWEEQAATIEVMCEKEAMASVLEPICNRYHVRFIANRGYSSATAMWQSAQRCVAAEREGKIPVVIYLGDHDPSGMDMSRDVAERLARMSGGVPIEIERLALNRDQVDQHQLPPNPAKRSDSRALGYMLEHGEHSWELDALDPQTVDQMLSDTIEAWMDHDLYDRAVEREDRIKAEIEQFADVMRAREREG